ncbi:MAG TPA: pentapeptide repeat-containing protein [Blastocatellia bacterium]|nr:pentapeptide repeat-containing protein [Blastocatellia bacterium]
MNSLTSLLPDGRRKAGRLVKGIKSITEFFSDAVEGFKGTGFPTAIAKAAPWAGVVGEAAAEALPPLKFFTKLAEELTKETDPEKLGLTACTIAYQRAVEKAFKAESAPTGEKHAIAEAKAQLELLPACEEVDIGTFSRKNPLEHEFVELANLHLQTAAIKVGYVEIQVDRITARVQQEFQHCLALLLSDAKTAEKFAPFRVYLDLGSEERQARKALAAHANYQRWLYEEAPVLGRSPFALKHVYIETECGKLTWGEIKPDPRSAAARLNPFGEEHGGRQPLIQTVLDLIASPDLKESIIVQGMAGAGKSSFTLKLCDELLKRNLHPVRVRIKDLSFDTHIKDALPKAVLFGDENYSEAVPPASNLFLDYSILGERGVGAYQHLCKYIFIFDGWDEISLSDRGFQQKVAQMLDQINGHFLSQNTQRQKPLVRVILTGRPTSDIGETNCLREKTPILSIRRLSPAQLRQFVGNLAEAVKAKKPLIPLPKESGSLVEEDRWAVPPLTHFEPLFKRYDESFKQTGSDASGELDALGLPLLAHLAVRLISEWPDDPAQLVEDTTTLYRHLIDLTCKKAGKAEDAEDDSRDQHKVYEGELRDLLHQTAAAITLFGQENIPLKELALRLGMEPTHLDDRVERDTKERKLSSLLISFYFKGGHQNLGCEFGHKSFREYLFAEGIVEALKDFGRKQRRTPPERANYWQDFDPNDAGDFRYDFSRNLSELLVSQWLTSEVKRHLERLIQWEIARAVALKRGEAVSPNRAKRIGMPTAALDWEGWKQVRTGVADLWEWWGEGVHLRPQVVKERRGREAKLIPAYVNELVEYVAPLDPDARGPAYVRTTTVDARLGEGLCLLAALVHAYMADSEQEPNLSEVIQPRKYQAIDQRDAHERLLFKPSGDSAQYFKNYIARINAAGWRPDGEFPGWIFLGRVNLRGTDLSGTYLEGARLSGANLSGADFYCANLTGTDLRGANLYEAYLSHTDLSFANLIGADLRDAHLFNADLSEASLDGAELSTATLDGANLTGATFTVDQIEAARFEGIIVEGELRDRETLLWRLRQQDAEEKKDV